MQRARVSFGPFVLDPEIGTLLKHEVPIAVGQRGLKLLAALLARPGEILTKSQLMDACWPGMAVEESNLTVQIASLRKLLGVATHGGEWIATVPRVGYRFVGSVDVLTGGQSGPSPATPSVAVLPFQNLSDAKDQQYFCDGITEDVITELSRFRQMRVASRHSSGRFRGPGFDVISVGRELGVDYLVEGSVRRLGPRTRITAQLIDATTGSHIWAERYDSVQQEVFDVHDRIVRTIVGTIAGRMNAARTELARRKPAANLAAYEHFLRGDALPIGTPEIEAEARRHFEKAVELDPGYARAYAMLSFSLEREWLKDMSGSIRLLDEALELARKAIALDENDFLSHLAMVWNHMDRHAFELAERHLATALSLNPNQPSILTDQAAFSVFMGQPERAIEILLDVRRLDPFFAPSWYWGELGAAYFMARRHDEAIASMRRATVLSYTKLAILAACHAMTDKPDLARQSVDEMLRRIPDFSIVRFLEKQAFVRADDIEYLAEGLRKAGLPS